MACRRGVSPATIRAVLRRMLSGPQVLAFLPALVLGAYWAAGEGALLVVALGLPLLVLLAGGFERGAGDAGTGCDAVTGLPLIESLEERLESALAQGAARGLKTACIMLRIDGLENIEKRRGAEAGEEALAAMAERLRGALREGDHLAWTGGARTGRQEQGRPDGPGFGIALRAVPHLDLEIAIQLSARLQAAAEEPFAIGDAAAYLTASVGFCLSSRSPGHTGRGMIAGALLALDEAQRNGPSSIRVYSTEMQAARTRRQSLQEDALKALDNGEIAPWFQPQISTDTGRVTGFEALARWNHPARGCIAPGAFLPCLEQAGQMERLGEVILRSALEALSSWDAAGLEVPCVAVNFTGEELRNPRLADRIRWDLDRFDLAPGRLIVEVLETVMAGAPGDAAPRNIARLAEMGCRIDLDDFGTGHASISAIRRFAIERIKIDRSFISHVDTDAEQQRMVSAILTMAERLGLDTLAEGVETAGEHAMLAQLGCRHVQGFGIARPMPFAQTVDWMRAHEARLAPPPPIRRGAP